MAEVFIALGTNLGDRQANLTAAREMLAGKIWVEQASAIYETQPWGYLDQPVFLNQVLRARTELSPLRVLNYLKRIEQQMGRQENFRYGPRLIDLDILAYDQLVMQTSRLALPHPRLAERAFMLIPLAEVAPEWVHPVLGKTAAQLAAALGDFESVHRW